MHQNFNKIVFVTGGAGFIGSNFINKFVPQEKDTLFVNIDCLTYAGDLANVTVSESQNYIFENVDIRNVEALRALFLKYEPKGVIHFAAESHVDLSLKNPSVFVETNVLGTNNLLLLSKEHKVERFHQISTDEVYGALTATGDSFTESTPLAPRNPYSASKASADLMVLAYHRAFGLNTVITRSSNVFGPQQDKTKLIPLFIHRLQNNEKVPLYGKGEQIREWTYVEDCIDAIHTVFTEGKSGEVYNIGSGNELSNSELTNKLLALFGKDASAIEYVEDRLGHDFRYSLDASKIKSELRWKPGYTFEKGLEETLSFYKKQGI